MRLGIVDLHIRMSSAKHKGTQRTDTGPPIEPNNLSELQIIDWLENSLVYYVGLGQHTVANTL